jgi:hypothetical protein
VFIGNSGISQATIVTAAGLSNTGTIEIQGSATTQPALEIGAAAPSTWTGRADLFGDALLQFSGTGLISTIGNGAQITLTGPQAYVAAAGINSTSNSALRGLTSNQGTFGLAIGASVTTSGGLNNAGILTVDSGSADGSSLNVTGTLSNSATAQFTGVIIGNSSVSQPVTVTTGGLANTGTFSITSGTASATVTSPTLTNTGAININGGTAQAALEVGSPASAIWTGTADLTGNALLQFTGTSQIGTIGSSSQINLSGPQAFVAAAGINSTSNSALTGLTTIASSGGLELENGATLKTNGGLTVNGGLDVDVASPGGSRLDITGTLANNGTVSIGNGPRFVSQPTTVTAANLANVGTTNITGTAPAQSALDIGTPAPSTWTGSAFLSGDALLQFTGTNQIGTIGNNATINLTGPQAFVAAAGINSISNSALTSLTTINSGGNLSLNNGASLTASGGVTVNGSLGVDAENEIAGGSSLNIAGTLTNKGNVTIGNGHLGVPADLTAGGLANSGTILVQSASGTANLTVSGHVSNSGTGIVQLSSLINGAPAILSVTGSGNAYSQTGGGTNVGQNTQLIAPNVNIAGGGLSLGSAGIQAANPATVVGNVNLTGGTMMGLGVVAGNLNITN